MTDAEGRPAPRRTLRRRLAAAWDVARGGGLSPGRASASVGVGLFVAALPLYGLQLPLIMLVCVPLRLNAALAYLVTQVSNPLTLPAFLAAELHLGARVLTGKSADLTLEAARAAGLRTVGIQIATGALLLGLAMSAAGAAVTWLLVGHARDSRERWLAGARTRLLARYAGATRPVRVYVAVKLRTDPALRDISRLSGSLGRVVDVGAGFGQTSLGLLELGKATSVVGVEPDPARLAAARAAAREDATFEPGTMLDARVEGADTVLFVDCLHYATLSEQDTALARAAAALPEGGRIVIREVSSGASLRSRFAEWLERRSARRGGLPRPEFRTARELETRLVDLGLSTELIEHDDFSLAHNVIVVGTRGRSAAAGAGGQPERP